MGTLVVNAKGQITLRRELLEHLDLRPDRKVIVSKLPNRTIEIRSARSTGKISDVFGLLKTKRKDNSLSIGEINNVIKRGWSSKGT